LVADFTGGTRPMPAALTLMARRWPAVQFQYISGQRTPGGAMLVLDQTEVAVYSPNPWDVLGYQAAEEAITLFDGGSPAAAFHYLLEPIQRASAGETKEALQLLAWLIDGYAAWDRFEHEEGHRLFTIVSENAERLGPLFSAASIEELRRRLAKHRAYLDLLRSASGLTRELVLDLLANAVRRMHEQRFDDAVARLYRACEALGQLRLMQQYQIKDFRSAPVALLIKGEVPAQLRGGIKGGRVRLAGLQDVYTFLHGVGDPLGRAFKAAGLADSEGNPLTARNRSILAHGLRPLGQRDAKLLLDKVLPLANVQHADLPLFPKMSGLS
jgi:CRISPR-associated protein (TIGR02710 family)